MTGVIEGKSHLARRQTDSRQLGGLQPTNGADREEPAGQPSGHLEAPEGGEVAGMVRSGPPSPAAHIERLVMVTSLIHPGNSHGQNRGVTPHEGRRKLGPLAGADADREGVV